MDTGRLEALARVMGALTAGGGALLLVQRTEVNVTLSGGFSVRAEGDSDANRAVAGEIGATTAETLKAEIWQAVANSLNYRGRW